VLPEDSVQSTSQKNRIPCSRPDDVIYCLDVQLTKAWSVRMTRTFRPDLPLCQEASNCSNLHPSGHFSSTSGWHLVFDKLWDFFPKHRYGKIAATIRMMWIPVRMCSSIRQVSHSKSRRLDASLHGSDAWATDMENAYFWSTVRMTIPLVRTRKTLIWKFRVAKAQPSGRQGNTVRTRLKSGKNFSEIFGKSIVQLSVRMPYEYCPDGA
jgi:hypothetical protein